MLVGSGRTSRVALGMLVASGHLPKRGTALTAVFPALCATATEAFVAAGARQVGRTRDVNTGAELTVMRVGNPDLKLPAKQQLSPAAQDALLDHTDVGPTPDPEAKERLRTTPIERRWEQWERHGYPAHLVKRIREGAEAPVAETLSGTRDFGEYPLKQAGDGWCIANEMVRCIQKGGMRWAEEGEERCGEHDVMCI